MPSHYKPVCWQARKDMWGSPCPNMHLARQSLGEQGGVFTVRDLIVLPYLQSSCSPLVGKSSCFQSKQVSEKKYFRWLGCVVDTAPPQPKRKEVMTAPAVLDADGKESPPFRRTLRPVKRRMQNSTLHAASETALTALCTAIQDISESKPRLQKRERERENATIKLKELTATTHAVIYFLVIFGLITCRPSCHLLCILITSQQTIPNKFLSDINWLALLLQIKVVVTTCLLQFNTLPFCNVWNPLGELPRGSGWPSWWRMLLPCSLFRMAILHTFSLLEPSHPANEAQRFLASGCDGFSVRTKSKPAVLPILPRDLSPLGASSLSIPSLCTLGWFHVTFGLGSQYPRL